MSNLIYTSFHRAPGIFQELKFCLYIINLGRLMMNLKSFLSLVEIRTKVASLFPLLIGTFYCIYRFGSFNPYNFTLFFLSLILIDMSTTALNHFYDFRRAKKEYGYNYDVHNPINNYNLESKTVIITIIIMILTGVITGLLLFLNTGLVVLFLGIISFLVGITYSFGPVPISRTPFGEIFSGLFMGFVIFFIATHIHLLPANQIVNIIYENYRLMVEIQLAELTILFLASLPLVLGIANIMLANNISDMADDKENDRYTLPIYIGKDKSLTIFKLLYSFIYIDILFLIIFNILPWVFIIFLLTSVPIYNNVKVFMKEQSKKNTFHTSIENFLWISISYVFSFILFFAFY